MMICKRQRTAGPGDDQKNKSGEESDQSSSSSDHLVVAPGNASLPRLRVFLDIDGTLIFASVKKIDTIEKLIQSSVQWQRGEADIVELFVNERPGVRKFLRAMHDVADLYIFTAATPSYARPIIDYLENEGPLFKEAFDRTHCAQVDFCGHKDLPSKDLTALGDAYDPTRTVLLDDSLHNFLRQPTNGMPIRRFEDNPNDDGLTIAREFIMRELLHVSDVRPVLKQRFRVHKQIERELTTYDAILAVQRNKENKVV